MPEDAIQQLVAELIKESNVESIPSRLQLLLLLAADTLTKQQDMLVKAGEMVDKSLEILHQIEAFRNMSQMDFGKTVN